MLLKKGDTMRFLISKTKMVSIIFSLMILLFDRQIIEGGSCCNSSTVAASCRLVLNRFGLLGPVGAAGATGAAGLIGLIGPQGLAGVTIAQFAMFYGLTSGTGNPGTTDYAATVAAGARVPFPRSGPTNIPVTGIANITNIDGSSFNLPVVGTYEVTFRVQTTEPGQLQLELNGLGIAYTTAGNQNAPDGGHEIVGNSYITTTVPNSVLAVINPPGNSPALTITPADGASTHANAQTITIKQIA